MKTEEEPGARERGKEAEGGRKRILPLPDVLVCPSERDSDPQNCKVMHLC